LTEAELQEAVKRIRKHEGYHLHTHRVILAIREELNRAVDEDRKKLLSEMTLEELTHFAGTFARAIAQRKEAKREA
jgi:transcriptional regulator of NAD metabolism